ncbi:hypothetical protein [Georgenia sp.]
MLGVGSVGCTAPEPTDVTAYLDTSRLSHLGWHAEPYISGVEMPKGAIEPATCDEIFELISATDMYDPVASYANENTGSYLLVKPMPAQVEYISAWRSASNACPTMSMVYGSATVSFAISVDNVDSKEELTLTLRATDETSTIADMLLTTVACPADDVAWLIRTLNTSRLDPNDVSTHSLIVSELCGVR